MPRSVEAEASHFGYRRKVAPQAARTSSRSDGAAACLSPERQPPVASTSGAQSEHRRYERGHVQEVTRIDKTRSPRATRSPDRDLHASDELARVLSPEALHSSSPPPTGPVQRRHYHGLAAQCPEPVVGERPAGGSTSNDHVFTRFHSGETGVDRPASPPGRRRLSPTPRRDGTTTKQAGALLPHFVGEKVAETADGWAAYREARPGGGVEVSWRRKVTPEHTEQHAAGTAFNASHTSVTLAQVVSGTGDGCISSFNVGAPKWAKAGNGDTARLQMSSFSKHRVGEASEPDSGSPRSVFARRRAAAEELEYDDWHRLQSRQTKAGVRRPPPTPQQWLQQKIQEAKTIPAVASILEPRELEEFMHQVAESTIDELEVHNHEFSDKIRRGNVVPQELKAWQFLQNFAQGCIQREVAKLDIIARAKTGSGPQLPQTPLALRIDGIDAAFAMDTPEQQRDMPTPVPEEQGRTASTVGETRLPQPSEQAEIAEVPGKTTRKEMFERMDVSSTGKLTLEQIQNGIEQSYPQLNHRAALLRAYKAADVNGDGLIGRREFRLLLEYLVFFSQSWQEFEAFAHGDNYRLSKSEFVACCEKLGLLVAKEAGEEFHVVDKNGGGYVLFEEFCCWAGIHKIGQTKQLWPKYKIEMDPFEPDLAVEQTEPRRLNRHARVISPDKGGRLSKPNRVWVNNKWQDSPQTTAMPGVDRATDRLSSPPRSTRLFSPVRTLDAADSTGASLLISPERQKPSHLLTSPERRTLRNRESALQDPGSSDEGGGVDASLEVSLTGVWRATGERRDGTKVQQGIYIRHEQDGRVTGGHVDGVNGFFVIKDGTVDGSTVWFRQEYSNGNRVVWEATIEQTYVSGIMVPKLVDGTWKGSNLQGSFTASLETMRLTPAEATGSGVATSRRKKKTAVLAGTTASTKQPVSSRADLDNVDAVTGPPEAPAQSELSLPHDEDLSGTWIALGFTSHGTQEREQFVLKHDVSSGGIHGHSVQEDDEDSFEIIDGVLEGRSIKFVQKFHDGLETLWEASVQYNVAGARARLEGGSWRNVLDGDDGKIAGKFTAELQDEPEPATKPRSGPRPQPEPELEPEPEPEPEPELAVTARQQKVAENAKAILERTPKRRPAATTPLRQSSKPANGSPYSGGRGTRAKSPYSSGPGTRAKSPYSSGPGTRAKSPFLRKRTGLGGAGSAAAGQFSNRLRSPSPSKPTRLTSAAAAPRSGRSPSRAGQSRGSASSRTPPAASTNAKSRPLSARDSGKKHSTPRAGSASGRRVKETAQSQQLSAIELQLQREGLDRSDLM